MLNHEENEQTGCHVFGSGWHHFGIHHACRHECDRDLIAAVLHAVNIVLAVFSPTIHSMRLHFVEFFGKFYEPGGKPYQPFRKSGGA